MITTRILGAAGGTRTRMLLAERQILWWGWRDSNPQAEASGLKPDVVANFTTPLYFRLYALWLPEGCILEDIWHLVAPNWKWDHA